MIRSLILFFAVCLSGAGLAAVAHAQDPTPTLPPQLVPWVGWVLHGKDDAVCPELSGRRLCAWPTLLDLELRATGGRFQLDVYLERERDVPLPGSSDRWPQGVSLDGAPAVVLEGPRVRVPAGRHQLTGEFAWPTLPESLATPADVGQLALRIEGKPVLAPRRDGGGLLWLQGSAAQGDTRQRLEVEVYRHVQDGVPARITTRLQLSVGGKSREVSIEGAVLAGTHPLELTSSLPVHLQPDGTLRVQVAPGEHRVELLSAAARPPEDLKAPTPSGPWAAREVWVFAADTSLREVEPSGAERIDPARTNLSQDWHGLPTFVVPPGGALRFETRRRGEPEPPPNELTLSRELWLDLSGQGYTVRDQIQGSMRRGWRLDLTSGELGRAATASQDQLITLHQDARGLELRDAPLQLTAEWRMPREGGQLPAVGWSEDMQSVHATLHLPPGWSLLGGEGADTLSGTWLSRWNLWSFFFVLLVSLAAFKLLGAAWGAVSLFTLGLCYHQPDALEGVWLWLLLALALTRVPLKGAWATAARWQLGLAALVALLTFVPFTVQQLRMALYPQVRGPGTETPGWLDDSDARRPAEVMEEEAPAAPMANMEEAAEDEGGVGRGTGAPLRKAYGGSLASSLAPSDYDRMTARAKQEVEAMDPGAVVQTGPGVPDWHWDAIQIGFDGPVQQAQTLRLWLIPPWLGRLLALLRVLFASALLFAVLRAARSSWPRVPPAAASTLALLALVLPLAAAGQAHAQATGTPDQAVLEELSRRLTEPPPCAPDCLSTSTLQVEVRGDEVRLRAEVHAGAVTAYRAPGPLETFAPSQVRVDGRPATGLARLQGGFLHVRLEPGRHVVELVGPLPPSDGLTLQVGTPPHHVSVDAPDFEVDGVRADGKVTGSIQLRRKVRQEGEARPGAALPPWLTVERRFDLSTRWRVYTTVRRLGRSDAAVLLRLPLLEGESATQADMQDADGAALVRLAPGQREVSFTTALDPRPSLTLVAPENSADSDTRYSVVWQIECATLYHCDAQGIAPVQHRQGDRYLPVYQPYPGESLQLTMARLAPAKGRSATIDRADLRYTPGRRLTRGQLDLSVRSSSGTTVAIGLPPQAELISVQVNGEARTAQLAGEAVDISLEPGSQAVAVAFRVPLGITTHFVAPPVRIQGELVNTHVHIEVPSDRWLLWAEGPAWGPAILFWGFLLAFIAFAAALSRVPGSPLRLHQWMLLSLGLTQIEAGAAAVVVLWFFALSQRTRRAPSAPWLFNTAQVLLVVLTLCAASILVGAVHQGLVVRPEMQVTGGGSDNQTLIWYVDRTRDILPQPGLWSLPLWIYRALTLAWALWLASSALRWLRFGWNAFSEGGRWKALAPRTPRPRRARMPYSPPQPGPPGAATPEPAGTSQSPDPVPPDPNDDGD